MDMTVGASGKLVRPELHDGKLFGIELIEGRRLCLSFLSIDGSEIHLLLEGLQRLRATDFMEGNIVQNVCIYTGQASTTEHLVSALQTLFGFHDVVSDLSRRGLNDHIQRILSQILCGDLKLFVLTSSYGCELLAVCASVTVEALVADR